MRYAYSHMLVRVLSTIVADLMWHKITVSRGRTISNKSQHNTICYITLSHVVKFGMVMY